MKRTDDSCKGSSARGCRACGGFTLIELLVVLAIIALLLSLAVPRYMKSVDTASETILMTNLQNLRQVIDAFHSDNGRYPESLDQLVERRYLRSLPMDPITESSQTWIVVPPSATVQGQVFDIRSGAQGTTRSGRRYGEL